MSKVRIGDLFELEKGSLQSSKCTEGEFDFITASKEWKTHNDFSHDFEALIFAAMASGSLGRTHYVNGKFITSDLCYILTPKDNDKFPIDLKFYHFVFNSLKEEIVKNTKSGTSKEAINQTNLKNYEIPYFGIEQQHLWIEKLLKTKSIKEDLTDETKTQESLLKKLRKKILQDAIEGKLTASWREQNHNVESASILLEKIKAEKEQLVKDKKIKKQKPLPPIDKEEIPFDIPDSWERCRLGTVSSKIGSGSTPRGSNYSDEGIAFFRSQNIHNKGLVYSDIKYIHNETHKKMSGTQVFPEDILLNITGGSMGRCAYVPKEFDDANLSQHVCIIRAILLNPIYLHNLVLSPIFQTMIFSSTTGAGREGLPKNNLEQFVIPVVPLEEQNEIVKKIESLFKVCDDLEEQINSSKTNSQTLMQSVLKEAFEK